MRIALGLPSRIVGASGELMLEWATRADRGPFSSLVVTDRVVSRALEPLAVLAIAGRSNQAHSPHDERCDRSNTRDDVVGEANSHH